MEVGFYWRIYGIVMKNTLAWLFKIFLLSNLSLTMRLKLICDKNYNMNIKVCQLTDGVKKIWRHIGPKTNHNPDQTKVRPGKRFLTHPYSEQEKGNTMTKITLGSRRSIYCYIPTLKMMS